VALGDDIALQKAEAEGTLNDQLSGICAWGDGRPNAEFAFAGFFYLAREHRAHKRTGRKCSCTAALGHAVTPS
jgi:hypothetical protein